MQDLYRNISLENILGTPASPESLCVNGFFNLAHLLRLGSATQVRCEVPNMFDWNEALEIWFNIHLL